MKKYFSFSIIFMSFLLLAHISCKKESSGNRLEDADIRILKVQRISQIPKNFEGGLNPFFDVLGLIEYQYNAQGLTKNISVYCNLDKSPCFPQNPSPRVINYELTHNEKSKQEYDINMVLNEVGYLIGNKSQYYKKLNFIVSQGCISKVQSNVAVGLPLGPIQDDALIYSYEYPMSSARNPYAFTGSLEGGLVETEPNKERKMTRKILSYGQHGPTVFQEISTSLHSINLYNTTFDENHISENLEYKIQYSPINGVPRKLTGLINAAILGYLKTGIEDVTSITLEQGIAGLPIQMRILEVDRADWMFLFAIAPYINPFESDHIVSSISRIGTRYDLLWLNKNTEVNSLETFPYTHDPIAKTLEIAGLKIWYEVVE
jgi:hypothetical protein